MILEEIITLITDQFPSALEGVKEESTPPNLRISQHQIHPVCSLLHSSKNTYFDCLSCLTGIDNGPEQDSMEVIYHLYSIPYNLSLALSVLLPRSNPSIDSVTDIWQGANWHEREAYDLLGIEFKNHPDLRRILLPDDWQGHPLRKDYQEQETYHEVKVKY